MLRKIIFIAVMFLCPTSYANMVEAYKALDKGKYKKGEKLLKEYAKVGNAEAQIKLGVLLYQGQSGNKDKIKSLLWLSLAAEQNAPNADLLAAELNQQLSKEQRAEFQKRFDALILKYGTAALAKTIYPVISKKPILEQKIETPAYITEASKLEYDVAGHYERQVSSVNQIASRRGPGQVGVLVNAINNLEQAPSGKVVVQFNIDPFGQVLNPSIIFSNPRGFLDTNVIEALNKSRFKSAKNSQDQPVFQYGMVRTYSFGVKGVGLMSGSYPTLYKDFRKFRSQSKTDPFAKYSYSVILRSHNNLLPESDREAFQAPLLEAANDGIYLAQLEYGLYQIYQNNDIESGLPWLLNAAQSGITDAEYSLGNLLINSPSEYLRSSPEKAKFWLKRAATKLHAGAIEKYAEIILQKDDKTTAKEIANLFKKSKKNKLKTGQAHYLNAKALHLIGRKSKSKKEIKRALKKAKIYKWKKPDWEKLANSINS